MASSTSKRRYYRHDRRRAKQTQFRRDGKRSFTKHGHQQGTSR